MSKPYRRRLHFPAVVWSVIALLIAAALGYAIYMVIVSNRTSLITAMVESASVDDGILADGVLIRDEELIMKQSGRVYAPIVQNGDRVSAGNSVAVSFSSQANLAKYHEMTAAQGQLELYQELSQTENTPSAMPALNQSIYASLRSIARYADGGLFSQDTVSAYTALESAALRRELALGGGNLHAEIAALQQTIANLRAEISSDMQQLKTDAAGYYVQSADGYEQLLTLAFIDDMTVSSLKQKQAFPASAVSAETVLGKIVHGYTWYAAVVLSDAEAAQLSINKTYTVLIAGDRMTASVIRLEPDSDAKAVLAVLKCDVPLSDMASERDQKCTIILGTYTGFKIPQDGLRILNDVPGVYVLEGAKAVFKPVDILFTGDSYYIVEANSADKKRLFLYDEIILGRTDLYDGKIVK